MLHFASYTEHLSEHATLRHPLTSGFALFTVVAVAVLLLIS